MSLYPNILLSITVQMQNAQTKMAVFRIEFPKPKICEFLNQMSPACLEVKRALPLLRTTGRLLQMAQSGFFSSNILQHTPFTTLIVTVAALQSLPQSHPFSTNNTIYYSNIIQKWRQESCLSNSSTRPLGPRSGY